MSLANRRFIILPSNAVLGKKETEETSCKVRDYNQMKGNKET